MRDAGAGSLSNAELLAILLRTGTSKESALAQATRLLARFEGLAGLRQAPFLELCRERGIGEAKAAQLAAVLEMARRCLGEQLHAGAALNSPASVREYLSLALGAREHEVFVAMFLDAQHRVIAVEELFRGTLTQTSVYPREVVKAALRRNAAALILAYNHPSGVAQPSQADELLTRSLAEALALIEVKVLDHFIVAGNQTLSFAERGLL